MRTKLAPNLMLCRPREIEMFSCTWYRLLLMRLGRVSRPMVNTFPAAGKAARNADVPAGVPPGAGLVAKVSETVTEGSVSWAVPLTPSAPSCEEIRV